MNRELTVGCLVLFSLGLTSGCDPTDADDQAPPPLQLDAGRDASASDAGHLDGSRPDIDAADGRASDASVSDARVDDAQVDRSASSLALQLAQLTSSRSKWRELAAASPGPYWYTEENCVAMSGRGAVATIQVEHDASRVFEERTIDRAECEALVDRYTTRITWSGETDTMEQLYDACEAQLIKNPSSHFAVDARGVIKACWYRREQDCLDSCGTGFYLRDWQFGTAKPTPDGGVRKDAGVTTDAGVRTDAGR